MSDTVFDADYAPKPYHERNGFVFSDYSYPGLESAMSRAIHMWYDQPQYFRELAVNAMRTDYSWNRPASDYLNIYNHIRVK